MKKLKNKIIVKILRELHFQPTFYCLGEDFCDIMHNPILDRHGMYVQGYDGVYYICYENGKKSRKFDVITSAFLKKNFPYVSKEKEILPDVNF